MKMLDLAPVGYHAISSKAHRFHIDHFFLHYCLQFDGQSAEAVERQQTSLPALLQGSHQREELCGPGLKRRLRGLWWAVTSKKTLLSNCLSYHSLSGRNDNMLKFHKYSCLCVCRQWEQLPVSVLQRTFQDTVNIQVWHSEERSGQGQEGGRHQRVCQRCLLEGPAWRSELPSILSNIVIDYTLKGALQRILMG